ncbi:MAG: gliding motility-associated C-terminal domain-containing protein, partial [Actinobacteria bacterium]|nr:gliding motility-associated C-terminal domain-containing protein [Actinomycetota bacterium]
RTVSLVLADTTQINFNTCDIAEVGSIENMYTTQDGCDSLVIETTSLYPLPILSVVSAIDYNGFDISCEGGMDGSAIANVSGVGPFTYLWSTDDTDQMITGLSEGGYDVAITDGNGCMTSGTITLTAPDAFMIGFEVSEPDCFDQQLGTIMVVPVGGVAPYTYSIDGTTFQASSVFAGLDEGIYQITSLDANDCGATEIISIDVPLMVSVDLGENQTIAVGDSALLQAIINLPFDSLAAVMWTGVDSIGCANCLTQIVAPIITTAYTVSVVSADGCADADSMTVFVNTDHNIYIPNIFSPNGDGLNDVLKISASDDVQEISSFQIFDRWGNLVFGAEQIDPKDSALSWDGKLKGEAMNPGVFTYKLVVVFSDGSSVIMYGDITLIR